MSERRCLCRARTRHDDSGWSTALISPAMRRCGAACELAHRRPSNVRLRGGDGGGGGGGGGGSGGFRLGGARAWVGTHRLSSPLLSRLDVSRVCAVQLSLARARTVSRRRPVAIGVSLVSGDRLYSRWLAPERPPLEPVQRRRDVNAGHSIASGSTTTTTTTRTSRRRGAGCRLARRLC